MPDGVGLNINCPDLAPGDLAGVKLTVQGRFDEVPGDEVPRQMVVTRYRPFEPLEDDHVFIPQTETVPMDGREVPRADTTALAKGFITITPIAADYTAGWVAQFRMKRLLKELLGGKHRRHHYYDRH